MLHSWRPQPGAGWALPVTSAFVPIMARKELLPLPSGWLTPAVAPKRISGRVAERARGKGGRNGRATRGRTPWEVGPYKQRWHGWAGREWTPEQTPGSRCLPAVFPAVPGHTLAVASRAGRMPVAGEQHRAPPSGRRPSSLHGGPAPRVGGRGFPVLLSLAGDDGKQYLDASFAITPEGAFL